VLVIGIVFIVGGGASVMTQHSDKLKSFAASLTSSPVALPAKFRCY
jgi:hypothetical protein